jgi:hypothetical protein
MKKIFIITLCCICLVSFSQTTSFDTAMYRLVDNALANCKKYKTISIADYGFFGKEKSYPKFESYLKDLVSARMVAGKFKSVDQSVVDEVLKENPWTIAKKTDLELNDRISMSIFEKSNQTATHILYGTISDQNDVVKVSIYVIKNGSFANISTTFADAEATDQSDKLLGKAVTHFPKPVPVRIPEKQPEPQAAQPAPTPAPAPAAAAVAPAETPVATADNTSKSTSDTGSTPKVKYRGSTDPLKGLNVAEEKKALQVGSYYALLIGIDNYKGEWAKLDNAVRDAQALEELLKKKYKFDAFRTLFNEQATRENIITELEFLIKNVKENDNVLIYYSGHGDFKQELNKGFWVPIDAKTASTAQCISNNDIQTYLGGIKSKHTLLISDACFSGDLFRGKTMTIPYEESGKYYSKIYNLTSRKAITSGGVEPVMDGGKDGHSIFAYYMLKSLTSNESSMYDAAQLFESIKIPVVNNSTQTPNFQPIRDTGDEGGQFIFIKK